MRFGISILGLLAGFAVAGTAEASSFIAGYEPEAPGRNWALHLGWTA